MIQLAWRFLLFQKERAPALWYRARTADSRIGTRMDAGRIIEQGSPAEVIDAPHHERTREFMKRVLH